MAIGRIFNHLGKVGKRLLGPRGRLFAGCDDLSSARLCWHSLAMLMFREEGLKEAQTTDSVLMVRPLGFAFNQETAATNSFMRAAAMPDLTAKALSEFEGLVRQLDDAGVHVMVSEEQHEPDALFPNNWVSFHADGTMVLYPMAAVSRRAERAPERVKALLGRSGFAIRELIDLTDHETAGRYLEGTGSLVLDRVNRRAFASLGPRTDRRALADFADRLAYDVTSFDALGPDGRPIYHTNVLLSLGTKFAMICLAAVPTEQRKGLAEALEATGRTIVEASWAQLTRFACNMLELRSNAGEPLIALSSAALACLEPRQRATLERLGGSLVDATIPTIEAVGGGGVRCMLAEVHLPRAT